MVVRYLPLPLALLLLSAIPLSQAAVGHRFSGFATLGLALGNNEDLVFRRDVTRSDGAWKNSGSWKNDSLLGVQWQGLWSPEWETTVQLVARDRFDNSLANSVEWAFIRYRPRDGLDLRLGRLGADVFMLSEYRQVGYAIPWARPPHDFYGIASLYNFDGADLNKRFAVGESMLNIKVFYGNSNETYPTGFNSSQGTEFDFDLFGLSASLEWNQWKLRYTYALVEVNSDHTAPLRIALQQAAPLWPAAAELLPRLETREKNFNYNQVGMNYDNNDWWLQAEFVRLGSDLNLVAAGKHAYASLGKRFGQFSVYGITGYASPKNDPFEVQVPEGLPMPYAPQFEALALAAERTLNGVYIKQRSYGIGARWDFTPKMALKLQAEKFKVDKDGTNLWLRIDSSAEIQEDKEPTVISLAWDVLF
jgi:hypothetical protein